MKNIIIIILIGVVLGGGAYLYFNNKSDADTKVANTNNSTSTKITNNNSTTTIINNASSTSASFEKVLSIGTSTNGNSIIANSFGTGTKEILIVAGTHGGYTPNTTLLARELAASIRADKNLIPSNIKVTIISLLNPDGLTKVVTNINDFDYSDVSPDKTKQIEARYNANKVDLNRNFDCNFKTTAKWQTYTVKAGDFAFSEPETKALKDYIAKSKPVAVIAYFGAGGGVYSSECNDGIISETNTINEIYSSASGYKSVKKFDSYETSGDFTNWLARMSTPAISVLLSNYKDAELDKNLSGLRAILNHFSNK